FSQKKRSIPFFSSAATYKVDEGRRRFASETGSARFGVDRKNRFARSLDSAKRRALGSVVIQRRPPPDARIDRDSQNNAQGKAA
ncbi:MAG: hypothetical protein IJO46_06915, partial [Thermoguttaceae bacterium]|nr:hypothetical protein [Thermoguttaceae bacterium]